MTGATVRLKLRWANFTTLTRQMRLPQPTDRDEVIAASAVRLFEKVWKPGRAVRLLGVAVADLGPPPRAEQLGLWDEGSEKRQRLQAALDALRERYGGRVVRRGVGGQGESVSEPTSHEGASPAARMDAARR